MPQPELDWEGWPIPLNIVDQPILLVHRRHVPECLGKALPAPQLIADV